jgi:hypothetical protein
VKVVANLAAEGLLPYLLILKLVIVAAKKWKNKNNDYDLIIIWFKVKQFVEKKLYFSILNLC